MCAQLAEKLFPSQDITFADPTGFIMLFMDPYPKLKALVFHGHWQDMKNSKSFKGLRWKPKGAIEHMEPPTK